jgi:cellulose biosynthesis protein BcsQ
MAKVIAVANMKGGVGKTTTIVALAEALAAEGKSVLVIDGDAQANASICIAGDQTLLSLISEEKTIDAFLEDYLTKGRLLKLADCIHEDASRVSHGGRPLQISLLASSAHLRLLERHVVFALAAENFGLNAIVGHIYRILREQLGKTGRSYDYVLIDCAPGISALTEASLRLSDLVIVPTIPDFLSTYGLQSFCSVIWKGTADGSTRNRPKALPKVLITRKRPVKEHERIMKQLQNEQSREQPSFRLFDTIFPEAIGIAEALGKAGDSTTLTAKWGANMLPLLEELARETREAIDAA